MLTESLYNEFLYKIIQKYIKSGIHYGHKPRYWNPKMAPYLYGEKYGLHIFNLIKTYKLLTLASKVLQKNAIKNNQILIVGTSKAASEITQAIAKKTNTFYINYRWLGGMLTNWHTFQKRIELFKQLEIDCTLGNLNQFSKKKITKKQKMFDKLKRFFEGVKEMKSLPSVVIFTSQIKENLAIQECKKLGIPTICIVDSNCDPDLVTYPIPGNDDSPSGIAIILESLLKYQKTETQPLNLLTSSFKKRSLFLTKRYSLTKILASK